MKILCLSTYPIDEPMHGGQHRLSNIVAELQARGHEVCSAGVLGDPSYPPSPYFAEGPDLAAKEKLYEYHRLMEDWVVSELFAKDLSFYKSLSKKINISPDVIFIEQPWLFQFAERLNRDRFQGRAKLIYGSQNIEHHLKTAILKRYTKNEKQIQDSREKVFRCEMHAIKNADEIFCVSQNDVDWIGDNSNASPILAANGVIDRRASMHDIASANKLTHGRKFALYCASAHPPNMEGFFDIFGEGAGCIPPESRLVVAGGAGRALATDPRMGRTGSLQHQFVDAGQVSESVLRGLLATAHIVVLPITSGGGTNLKTAEALWAGKHIVATTTAMRGFEQFSDADGVVVTDDHAVFLNAVRKAFLSPGQQLSMRARDERRVVLWEHTLAKMMDAIDAMETGK